MIVLQTTPPSPVFIKSLWSLLPVSGRSKSEQGQRGMAGLEGDNVSLQPNEQHVEPCGGSTATSEDHTEFNFSQERTWSDGLHCQQPQNPHSYRSDCQTDEHTSL